MQEIFHYSIIEIFSKIGKELGYLPIKEYSLLNSGSEITEQRVDLVWIRNNQVEYAFEFETTRTRKCLDKLMTLSESIKKYIFFVNKSFNFESVDAIFIKDAQGLMFLHNLKKYGMKVTMQGKEMDDEVLTQLEKMEEENGRSPT